MREGGRETEVDGCFTGEEPNAGGEKGRVKVSARVSGWVQERQRQKVSVMLPVQEKHQRPASEQKRTWESEGREGNERERKRWGKVWTPERKADSEGNWDEKVLGLKNVFTCLDREREGERQRQTEGGEKSERMFCRKTTFLLQPAKIQRKKVMHEILHREDNKVSPFCLLLKALDVQIWF